RIIPKYAVVDMDRLQQIIHIWICDIYHAGPNAKRDRIPNHTWTKAFEKFAPVQTEFDIEDLNLIFCRTLSGQLRRDGVTFRHLRYSSHALAELRARVGDHQVVFKVDPENLGYIYVSNQLTKCFLKVPAVKFEYASSVTLHQHMINCKATRQEVGDSYCDDDIQEANSRIHQLVDEAFTAKTRSSKRTGRTSKAARYVEDSRRAKASASEKQDEPANLTSDSNVGDEPKKRPSKPVDTTGWEFL
ncbi:Mu transposase C-terminal domain-containing protein, partial [Alishewanella sp. WH16-1]|uniref:Mu transposase C-terminal domain-containing protein n=1 Tax=Alishewanella sp. WH16-1 TaxID=1651088 RepID=UPI000A735852